MKDRNVKIKFYLRGLATGIAVAVVLLTAASGGKDRTISESDLAAKAEGLGTEAVPGSKIQDQENEFEGRKDHPAGGEKEPLAPDGTESSQFNDTVPETETETEAETETETETETVPETGTETEAETGTETETETEAGTEPEVVLIVIQSGNGSEAVASMLAEAGLVESAREYNSFLCENGYDRRLSVGAFEIPKGSSWEEIAGILTGQK